MKNEHWILPTRNYFVREDNEGPDPQTGRTTTFPYRQVTGLFLEGYHALTKRCLHVYGPFASIEALETFAREHHIDLGAKR